MRDAINNDEGLALARALRAGKTWEEAKAALPGVDPAALDAGWKEWAHREAGVELTVPVVVTPEPAPEPEDDSEPKKRGRK